MARLIPRKQIEEQQNITGSLTINESLFLGNDAIISGSLFVSKSFFLGNDTGSKSEITSSVFVTGSFTVDGLFSLGAQTLFSGTASFASESVDTQRYSGILAKDFGANLPTLYVSSTDGDDTNDGRTIQYPLRTIKRAAALASPGYDGRYGFDTGSISNGYVIKVQAGTYLEDNPVILPKNTTIWGAGLRITKINAKTPTEDLFHVNAGCYIAEVTMGGLRLFPDQINPEKGFAVAFQPGAFITTSPYIQNCSQISNQENSFTELYEDIPPGGGGLYVNGDVIDPDSPLASMVLDAYTQISPNGVGCLVNGRGFIQLVSFFNNFSYYAIRVNNGGHATLNNSNISFGLYGMYASGSRLISGSGGNIAARDSVRGTWSCVVDVLNKGLENGLPTITKLNTAEGIRLTSPALYTQSRVSVGTPLSTAAADEISADYTLISEIVDKGVTNFPTLLAKSSIKGYGFDSPYNILGAEQITSSIAAASYDTGSISASYAALLSILANGTGSFNFKSNTSSSRQIGTDVIQPIANTSPFTGSVSSSFGTVINIITKGVSVKPTYIANTSASIKGGTTEQTMLGVTSSLATINSISASFSIVYNILANGTGSNIISIPANHQKSFVITNNNSSSFNFEGIGSNPTLTLFRGETYKFNIDAIETFGGIEYPFWIRTEQLAGITERYDYNIGMVNNGDSRGTITFTVPYNAPNRLYYVSQNRSSMGGVINIVNSSTTPFDLIKNTLTYPATIQSGSIAKTNIDIVTAYEILTNNKIFIQDEVIQFVSSSWSGFSYPEETCKRDVGYIVDGVAKDLLFGGNEESIRNGLFYYQYPSQATTTQLGPTLTAMKHAAGVSLNLIRGNVYVEPTTEVDDVWDAIRDNKTFVQNEVITYLSSSWSNFYYNEEKCRRDTGYILDAVATDIKYGGNERSITAGEYYYQYPSLAIVRGDGDGVGQLGQTTDGIRYASGLVDNLLKQRNFTSPPASTLSAYNNLINNKELIQNETIQFINVAFPNLKYNQTTCKRDVGYIVDNVATDLLYGGIERGIIAGRYYYDYPSLATTTQRTSTIAGVKYAKIIGDTIVQNIILDTPRIVYNDEKNFKLASGSYDTSISPNGLNITSSFSGSVTQQTFIGNTFSIIEGIVARGLSSIKSLLAQNTGLTWNKYNPISVSSGSQTTSSYTTPNEVNTIGRNFDIVNTIIDGGLVAEPLFTSSHAGLTKVTTGTQTTASFAVSGSAMASLSSSFALITGIITDGVKSFTPTTATYNPADGNFVMTIPSHTLKTSNGIYLRPESFVFTCDMDGNRTEHKLPSAGQPAYTNRLKIQSVTNNTVTVNVGASGPNVQFTPTNATYNPANGDFVLTIGSHTLSIGEGIVITTGSIAFTCDMDNNQSVKSYPRFGIDPFAGRSMMITNTTATTLTVNVGASGPNKYFTPTTASYNALTGDMVVTVGQHGLGVGRSVVLENNSIAFTCDQDGNTTTHSYPRSGSDPYAEQSIVITSVGATQHTVTNAPYNAETGDVTLTIASHSFSNGDYVKIADNSLTYTCILDGNLVSKSYPRVGYDYPSGRWLAISNVTTNTFDINIGASSYTSAHTFVSATANGVERQNGIFTINVGDAGSASGSIHTFVSASSNAIKHLPQSVHTFVSASANAIKHLPQSTHTFVRTNQNSVSTVPVLVQNTYGLIKVTNNVFITSSAATNVQSASISSSFGLVERVLKNGTSIIPALTSSLNANIKVTNASQYISASYSASTSDVNFISSSISIVTKIIEGGEFSAPAFQTYTNRITSSNSVAAYEILKNNIPFIVSESIAYLSSSWSAASYDEDKCRRDLGFILSGSAEDLIWNANSASVFNGLFYWEFPSQAQGAQLQQTLDGINYASRLAQKVILNTPFVAPSSDVTKAKVLLRNNTQFIKDETIAYLSSSWIGHDYNETTCKRDVGHILDAAITDMVYGGNERSRVASYYYFTYPSAATGSQLMQTVDGINYANRLAQKTVLNSTFIQAESNKINASNLIRLNRDLIANEVVEYVSSSWSDAPYDDIKCRRDVKYILDAVRTDLVYGGNERSKFAGEYYYEYPSKAIVAGVPSATAQLDSTITGIDYGSGLVQNIIKNNILSLPSAEITNAAALVRKNRAFLQQNTIDYVNETYPNLDYIESKCYRDTGFIVDAVITDLVYGGNERSITAGRFYYLYPSQATGVQSEETIDSLNFTKGLAKLVAIGGKSIEDGFDIVANVIESGSNSAPIVVLNTAAGIKATTAQQITSSISVGTNDKSIVSSSFGNVLNIVSNGTGSIPTTIVKNTNRGVNVLGGVQITSSNTPATSEKVKVTTGFDTVITIVANGTGSIPTIVTNVNSLIKRTTTNSYITTASIASTYLTASNNSFDIVLDIVENGTGSLPTLVKNTDSLVKITNTNQFTSSVIISSSLARNISGSFDKIINILENGTGSLPTIVTNVNNIKVTNATQYFGVNAATQTEANAISASISIVTNIIANGTGSLPNVTLYTSSISSSNVIAAYTILKSNLDFIVSESIAYLSSSWSTASYDESKCRRDLAFILSGSAEDLIWNANSASVFNGKFYYEFPSQAQGAQLNQTLDGIKYASRLAQKLVLNTLFVTQSAQVKDAYTLLVNNKEFIKDEVIPYISSSWSTHQYVESTCKRDIVHIIDAVSTDLLYGGNERTINAGVFYYLYPSEATGSQIQETVTGIEYAKNLAFKILRRNTFIPVSQNKLQAKELIYNNRAFIQNEVISYISASWSTASYNETTCKRDVGHILDAVTTDIVYGGNERSINAGKFYYEYPSQATTSQLGPTLSGIKYAKDLTNKVLINSTFVSASNSNVTAYELIFNNKAFIQNETIAYLSSSWSAFPYNQTTCKRDIGYILDAVATDILYGGNERVAKAGEYYYLYPSLAIVGNDGDTGGQLNQTLDGIKYAKGITEKIVANLLLQSPTTSELTGFNLLTDNKKFIQSESIAYLSSSWSGDDGFSYNETTCKRDIGYIVDAVRTDLLYGGNERSSKAGEYYYLYPSAAILTGSISPTTATQKGPTLDGIQYLAGTAENIIANKVLISPTGFVTSSVSLLRQNKLFIQNETVQYIDAFFPNLVYLREKCRRDVGYILDAVITDTFYGGNQRSVIAGQYYYLYPSLATKSTQVRETVEGVDYAKALSKAIVQNIKLNSPTLTTNTDGNIKVTDAVQYTSSSISASISEVNQISSSFALVTNIIKNGLTSIPTIIQNGDGLIKVTNTTQYSSSISASGAELDIITSSFKHVADIIENGVAFVPDSLARNYDYGFELSTPTLLHISSKEQTIGTGSYNLSTQITNVSSSYGTVVNVVKNGLSVLPTLVTNTSSSLKVTNANPIKQSISASSFDTNKIASGFDLILNVIENGTLVLPTIISNTSASIKVTDTPQLISGSASGRLQGKLISSSLSLVIDVLLSNGTSSIGFKPSTYPIANTNAKINSAYNLLVSNSKFIVDETIAYMSSSWSGFEYTQSKCERDLTGILSGSAFDLLYGGNSASLFNGKFYFDFPSKANGSQLDQTITAIKYASGLAEKVVLNTPFTHISASINQPTSASWNSLRANKAFIQSESIAYLSSSWDEFEYTESTCRRDIGYIIDAVATDLLYGGNERSVVAGRYYYDFPSQATNAQLEPTLTGVRYAKGTAMNVVVNKQIFTASLEVQYAYDLIKANKLFIQSESIAFVNAKYPNLDYSESKCYRDLGYIIDGVATDLLYGGNERSRKNGDYYYQFPSQANGSGSQVVETIEAIKYAARITTASISSTLIGTPSIVLNTLGNIKVTNANQYISASSATSTEATILSASIAIVTNIVAKGTGSAIISASLSLPTSSYTTTVSNDNRWIAYGILKNNISFIQDETIAYLSSSWSTASYDESKCRRDVGLIISGAAEDLVFNSNSASLVNGKFYFESASQAQGAQLNQTLDGINYASKLAQKVIQNVTYVTASAVVSASYALIRNNREFIQSESIAYLSSSWSTAEYSESICKRDIGHIIDAVSTDLLYGGNERSTNAGVFYYLYPSQAQGSQLQPTLAGVNYAGQLSKNVAASLTFVTASQIVSASVNLLRKNRDFIQKETLAYLTASWSTFEYDKDKCKRDVGYILDGVTTDLLYGGNERGVFSGEFYYKYPSKAIIEGDGDGVGQLGQTIDGINYASRIAQKIAKNTLFVTASLEASASFDLLRKNKQFVAAETIAYVSSSWSGVYYNQTTCKRDVGYLIDAAATDVLYGGQERTVIAGQYYYLYPSNAINKGVPSTLNQLDPTLTGIRYAGKLSKKVVTNPTYIDANIVSASLVLTAKLLTDNKELIQKETITFLSSSWSNLKYNEASCSRDLGFIIDAIRTDLVYGGNERSIEAGSYYYKFPSVAILESYGDNNGQKKQTIDGINFARGISEKIVANTLLSYLAPSTKRRQAAERLKSGKDELKQRAIGYTNGAFPYLVYNEASCSRDTGFIVDACVTDLLYGGNERGIRAASSYYDGQYGSAVVVTRDQLLETLETNRYLRTKAEFIAAGAPLETFGSLIVATGIDYSYNGSGVTFKALPPNQGGSGVANPLFEITELGGGRIFFTSGNETGDFRIGTGLSINQATGTLVGRTFSKSLFSLVTPFSLALQI
jgi:hypothetical protein